jgi:DNA primase
MENERFEHRGNFFLLLARQVGGDFEKFEHSPLGAFGPGRPGFATQQEIGADLERLRECGELLGFERDRFAFPPAQDALRNADFIGELLLGNADGFAGLMDAVAESGAFAGSGSAHVGHVRSIRGVLRGTGKCLHLITQYVKVRCMSKSFSRRLTGSSNPDFARIKATTDIVAVIEACGIALKREGNDFVGLCPFHEDTTPSLRVTPGKGLFRCMSCGVAGNVIQFVARKENLTEREAALKLCGAIPGVQRGSELRTAREKETAAVTVDEATRAKLLGRVVAFYARTLHKDRAGLEYLKMRRLDDPAALETFCIGYCNGTLRNALPKSGELIEQLQALGILNARGNEIFYGRVVVPIFDANGNVAGLYGRRLTSDEPRHLYLRGERRGVFNGIAARTTQSLILVEAIFDALSLWSAGYRNVIALYGKDGWTSDHEVLVRQNGIVEIVLALDGDARGQEAADALASKLAGLVKAVHRITWPEGVKDANEFFLSRSAEEFRALLPQPSETSPNEATAREEKITLTPEGFAFSIAGRRYELCAIEKPSASRLKATIKALSDEPSGARFHIDTVDFYLSRSRKSFIAEAARLFREMPETIEADVNRLIGKVEDYLKQKFEGNSIATVTMPDADRLEALRMGRSAGLVDELQRDLAKLGIIGEEANRLLLYLGLTSRKMEEPLAIQILSSSGAGKSHLQDAVLSLCPEEELLKLTSLSGQALFYKGEDSLRHKCLAIAEVAGAEGARYALRNLISEKKLVIESTIKNALSGRLETQLNVVRGPTAVFETTINPDTDPETKSRYILLSVDESPEQTKAIIEAQRQSHTLDGRKRGKLRAALMAKHHAFQRLLEPLAVVNPFEPLLSYGDDRLAFRRDHPKYLNLILAVTFLHQMQRPRKHDAELGDYIETTLDDIAIANELAHQLFGQSLDDLSFPSRQALERISEHVERRARELNTAGEKVQFSRRELRETFGWSDTRLRVYLRELVALEYLAPVCGRNGLRYCYRLITTSAIAPNDAHRVACLKDVETLRQEAECLCGSHLAGLNAHPAARNGHPAATSPRPNGEVKKSVLPSETNSKRGHLAAQNGTHVPVLCNEADRTQSNAEAVRARHGTSPPDWRTGRTS